MQHIHLIDIVAAVVGVTLATVFRHRLRYAARRLYQRTRRRVVSATDWLFGPATRVVSPKSLPFYAFVKMPEADYLAVVTLRKYTYGRRRGRKSVEVRAHIVMDPGEEIPLPPPLAGERDAGDAVYSLLVPHADSLEHATEQVARYATGIRVRRAGWRWTPAKAIDTAPDTEPSHDERD